MRIFDPHIHMTSRTTNDYEAMYATQQPLYSYMPNNDSTAVPDLASGQPIISNGGKTVTVHIKPNVMFGPPVSAVFIAAV